MRTTLEQHADRNLAAAMRRHAAWQRDNFLHEEHGVLLHRSPSGLPIVFHNCAIAADAGTDPGATLDAIEGFHGGAAFTVLTQEPHGALEDRLATSGYTARADSPVLLVEHALEVPALPAGWRLDWVGALAGIQDFVVVMQAAYASLGLDPAVTPGYFAAPQAMLQDDLAIVLARDAAGLAAAGAMVLLDPPLGGIYWVGVLPERRGLRLAQACTAAATNFALRQGAAGVTLQASPMGEGLYRRMGFRDIGRVRRWSPAKRGG